jgi:[ribosomal protein S18]-alanine N-acetyltransferase
LIDAFGRLCGVCALVRKGEAIHLARVAIVPNLRGTGLGKILMRHAIAMAKSSGARTMTLYAYERNIPALRLYTGCGFEEVSRASGAPAGGDTLMLSLDLMAQDPRWL